MIGKKAQRKGWKIVLLTNVLLLHACAVQSQTGISAKQQTATATQPLQSVTTPTSSHTPTLAATPTIGVTSSKMPSRTAPATSSQEATLIETFREDGNSADPVQIEPHVSDAILLEETIPTPEPHDTLQSDSQGNNLILPPDPSASIDPGLILPDLSTLPPTELRIRVNSINGQKWLRFTNSIMNFGPGKMELYGDGNPDTGKITVTQYILRVGGGTAKVVVGEFFFHPEHDHWHIGDFARYDVLSLGPDGELDAVVASSNKVSYCLRDDERSDLPDAPAWQAYTSCDNEIQGISVGWIDIYRQYLAGQKIDITSLPDGTYALRSTVNPENNLMETNRENNTAILYIDIEDDRVKVIEPSDILSDTTNNQN